MSKKFKDATEMMESIDLEKARQCHAAVGSILDSIAFTPPEAVLPRVHAASAQLDALANALAIDHEMKRIVAEFFERCGSWLDDGENREVSMKPIGDRKIQISWRDEEGRSGEFVTTARHFMPHLGRALIGTHPPNPTEE